MEVPTSSLVLQTGGTARGPSIVENMALAIELRSESLPQRFVAYLLEGACTDVDCAFLNAVPAHSDIGPRSIDDSLSDLLESGQGSLRAATASVGFGFLSTRTWMQEWCCLTPDAAAEIDREDFGRAYIFPGTVVVFDQGGPETENMYEVFAIVVKDNGFDKVFMPLTANVSRHDRFVFVESV